MQLLSRVMGGHKNCVLGFYTYIVKYLTYHQLRIPSILVALAQSVHEYTPPDALTPVVRKLAQEFVHPGVGSEVIAAGLNSIREVCRRQPWAMEEDLLGDLIEYRKSRDKAVTAAARGLLQLFREVNPGMLKKRERVSTIFLPQKRDADCCTGQGGCHGHVEGYYSAPSIRSQRRGCRGYRGSCGTFIFSPPLLSTASRLYQLLEDHLKQLREEDGVEGNVEEDDEAAWEGWDVEEDSSDESSDGWVEVESDSEEIEISDSEDEGDKKKSKAKGKKKAEEDAMDEDEHPAEPEPAEPARVSSLATTKVRPLAPVYMELRLMHVSRSSHPLTSHYSMSCA